MLEAWVYLLSWVGNVTKVDLVQFKFDDVLSFISCRFKSAVSEIFLWKHWNIWLILFVTTWQYHGISGISSMWHLIQLFIFEQVVIIQVTLWPLNSRFFHSFMDVCLFRTYVSVNGLTRSSCSWYGAAAESLMIWSIGSTLEDLVHLELGWRLRGRDWVHHPSWIPTMQTFIKQKLVLLTLDLNLGLIVTKLLE